MKVQMVDENGKVVQEFEMADPEPRPPVESIDPLQTKMCTVICNYFATGEGVMRAVMYTRGYGPHKDRKENARDNFARKYGRYYAAGCEVHDGMVFDFPGSESLVSEHLKKTLLDFVRDAGGLEYDACLHYNFS